MNPKSSNRPVFFGRKKMKFLIPIICFITLLSNFIYIFYGSPMGKQVYETNNLFTYKTPDNEIWINKDKTALDKMRSNYINGSDSIITRLEAENQQVIPFHNLDPEEQEKLLPSNKTSNNFLIFNSLIIVSGFSIICLITLRRKQTGKLITSDFSSNRTDEQVGQLEGTEPVYKKNVKDNNALNNGTILNKTKDIICEILQIINKYSENDIAPKNISLENFANEQISKIKASPSLDELLAIENNINKTIPHHFETTRNLVSVKFKELRAMLNELAEDFGSITKDNTNFSSEIKDSMLHIEKAVELDEIKEIRKKITHETNSLRKTIAKKQEKDSIIIESLTFKVKAMNEDLASAKEEIMIDGLTQIYNRKAFDKKISEAFNKKSTKKNPFTLVMVDIDYFKKINDEYGHTVGDEVLKKVAMTIKGSFRLNDVSARYGGEEFVIMINSTDRQYAQDICERLRSDIENINFKIDNEAIPISVSVGIAFCKKSDTPETLLERADKSMYLAKQSGRNTVKTEEQLPTVELETIK
ncbi:MAG: GGDEF domain protein [Candidatus Scalindua rubra]|uniref:diguanylate cyclase n=1 Tax=Candidatus Scalindua rubra TaxID=1872076 RepID=A0A1E3XF15_9BACT|nr:MAG: GGDEF domain protein [Candidatus Scalindua rubra]